ncbi:MAG TPA: ATP-dependent helicase HrpB [Longimicrobiales bacterium]|nr:ATP-dependent helicase HrpB [Longimicrobiales bacterium]
MTELPIEGVLPELLDRLATGRCAVLQAPPGAGKTTRVPLALLGAPWLAGRIIMLEPRRLAARAAAAYMARLLGESVGRTVGYRIRLDTRVGPETRIEVVTEGVLTRILQHDPALEAYGAVLFDEFHERSLHADLGLALTLDVQSALRPDLRILVMSATLDSDAVAEVLGSAPVVRSEGRSYPVETTYLPTRLQAPMEATVARTIRRALDDGDGDILAFLPGAAEIRRTARHLEEIGIPPGTGVVPLYGDLPQAEQDRAIAPSPPGRRKIVLATSIAETSLTIEGIRIVVDSGLMRVPRFSPRTGMTRLATVAVSRAAADQRRGRAGRTGPGVCQRLWTEAEHAGLLAQRPPEIADADLAPLALELAAWGVVDPGMLRWTDAPPAAAYGQARELLRDLDALDGGGRITDHGRRMAGLPAHPRLAHMLLSAESLAASDVPPEEDSGRTSFTRLACDLAALLGERDVLRSAGGPADPDLRLRLPLLRGSSEVPPPGLYPDRGALHRARSEARRWRRRLGVAGAADTAGDADEVAGALLALAYPDRIGQRRGGRGRFRLRNGRGAALDGQHNLAREEFIVAAEVGGHGRDSRVFLAAPIDRTSVEGIFAPHTETRTDVRWDSASGSIRAVATRRLGALTLAESPVANAAPDVIATACLDAVRREGLGILAWTPNAELLRQRLAFLHATAPGDWPDVSDEGLMATLETWLLPFMGTDSKALRRIDPAEALLALAGWDRRADIDRLAPTHLEVPSGSRRAIDYSDTAAPVLAVRLQEMFGLDDTPRIAGGLVPLTLHLLSPAQRPVQVTRDLASFWRNAYFDVRRDLRGRYPRHYWPENPLEARPTHRTRPGD